MTNTTNNTVRCSILFLSGTLEGLTYDNHPIPASAAKVGLVVKKPVGGGSYKIIAVNG